VSGAGGGTAPEGVAWGTSGDFDGDGYSEVTAAAPGTRLAIVLVAPGEPARADRVLMVATA
jgi:hypothetical protein